MIIMNKVNIFTKTFSFLKIKDIPLQAKIKM
jgi:hypothetical protein